MKKNMSGLDRTIRVILAFGITGLFLTEVVTGTFGMLLSFLAIIFLLTSAVSICPIYALFGFSTCTKPENR